MSSLCGNKEQENSSGFESHRERRFSREESCSPGTSQSPNNEDPEHDPNSSNTSQKRRQPSQIETSEVKRRRLNESHESEESSEDDQGSSQIESTQEPIQNLEAPPGSLSSPSTTSPQVSTNDDHTPPTFTSPPCESNERLSQERELSAIDPLQFLENLVRSCDGLYERMLSEGYENTSFLSDLPPPSPPPQHLRTRNVPLLEGPPSELQLFEVPILPRPSSNGNSPEWEAPSPPVNNFGTLNISSSSQYWEDN